MNNKLCLFVYKILVVVGVLFLTTTSGCSIFSSKKEKTWRYALTATQSGSELGVIVIQLYPTVSPKHCMNFDSLVRVGFYNGLAFHRVIPGFMIQGGDPNTRDKPRDMWGQGDPSQTRVPAEFNDSLHVRGTLSAARTNDPNSATSQFFLCVTETPWLNKKYTVYGQAISGMEVADQIVNSKRDSKDNPLERIEMKIRELEE